MPKHPLPPATARKALDIAAWLKEKKADEISILNMSGTSPVAEAMVIVTAQGARHAQALADWLLKNLAQSGQSYLGMEGYREARWILVDCNDVLVHIFQEDGRRFYNLDGLWSHCPVLALDTASMCRPAASAAPAGIP
ncbi:MAG TPA: ribosome silencing factor [Desulfonatronum sp.]|nr:ribosome silencing factor [Desulfonatronum sp.]